MSNPFSLEGKTVLVTGASSGIGRATAIECSRMGATVVITGRNAERLQATFDALEGAGHRQIVADLTDEDQMDARVEQLPALQGVVNNAGITETHAVHQSGETGQGFRDQHGSADASDPENPEKEKTRTRREPCFHMFHKWNMCVWGGKRIVFGFKRRHQWVHEECCAGFVHQGHTGQ